MQKRGRPFEPGNKFGRGRPRGSRNKRTLLVQELLTDHSEALVRKSLVLALKGDAAILRTLLGCVLPRSKGWPVSTGNLRTDSTVNIAATYDGMMKKVSNGMLTLAEGQELAKLLQGRLDLQLITELERRLRTLEEFRQTQGK
jgi:hypothetical protein